MADRSRWNPVPPEYHFGFSRAQFAFVVIGAAFICLAFFVFGFQLGKILPEAGEQPTKPGSGSVAIAPNPTPAEPDGEDDADFLGSYLGEAAEDKPSPSRRGAQPPPTVIAAAPTEAPSAPSTAAPAKPTQAPTQAPTAAPTKAPTAEPTKPPTPRKQDFFYTIQVGSFKEPEHAQEMMRKLKKQDLVPSLQEVTVRPGDVRYRVRVGNFIDESDAQRQLTALKGLGYSGAFLTRSNSAE